MARGIAALCIFGAVATGGCATPPPVSPPSASELVAHVPGEGDWVLVVRPDRVERSAVLVRAAETAFGPQRVAQWRGARLLDPSGRSELSAFPVVVVARYADGMLLLAPRPADLPSAAAGAQSAVGQRIVVARALGAPRAFDVVAHALSPTSHPASPPLPGIDPELLDLLGRSGEAIAVLWPGPPALPVDAGLGQVLAEQRAMLLAVDPVTNGMIRIRATLAGRFPEQIRVHLARFFEALRQDTLGQAFGGPEKISDPVIVQQDSVVTLSFQVEASAFEHGIQLLFGDVSATLLSVR